MFFCVQVTLLVLPLGVSKLLIYIGLRSVQTSECGRHRRSFVILPEWSVVVNRRLANFCSQVRLARKFHLRYAPGDMTKILARTRLSKLRLSFERKTKGYLQRGSWGKVDLNPRSRPNNRTSKDCGFRMVSVDSGFDFDSFVTKEICCTLKSLVGILLVEF